MNVLFWEQRDFQVSSGVGIGQGTFEIGPRGRHGDLIKYNEVPLFQM